MMNPFTHTSQNAQLPSFLNIHQKPIIPTLEALLQKNRIRREELLQKVSKPPFLSPLNFSDMREMEAIEAEIMEFWNPIDHMQTVAQTEQLTQDHQAALTLITTWGTESEQDQRYYEWVKRWAEHPDFAALEKAQQTLIRNILSDFRLSGIDLETEKQKYYESLQLKLAQDSAQFENNIVNSSREGALLIQDEKQLEGLPERVIEKARQPDHPNKAPSWLFKIDGPTLQAIMTNAKDRKLREAFYTVWVTRACETTQFDNTDVMYRILKNRHELSQLTHFNNYAERSLADNKMAKTPKEVTDFLTQLLSAVRSQAEKEVQALELFAHQKGHPGPLCDWDVAYFSEQLRQATLNLEEEKLRVYFPLPHVLKALFEILHAQFNLQIEEVNEIKAWDPFVKVLVVKDSHQRVRGYLYLDLYARENKRSGAWVHEYTQRRLCEDGKIQLPIGFLTCNFPPPFKDEPALLTHDDVVTLFHEMGHALHHTLTQVNYASVSGIKGVPWDAVEFPSQLLEQFAWDPFVLSQVSAHYQTGEPLPKETIKALYAARHFQAGLHLIRQLELGLFDFNLHLEFDASKGIEQIQKCLDRVRQKTRVLQTPDFNRFQHSFGHIFSGGYAAGYYSYLWAEVLAADAFNRFVNEGLKEGRLNPEIGQAFVESVLELGGSRDILELFKKFQKRDPDNKAFLRQWNLLPSETL